jgi:short-subunit dehydrogenase
MFSRIEKATKMKYPLKRLQDQIIVITGASSGIGLTTARYAAKRGAKLVLASRNEKALKQLTSELAKCYGCQSIYVVADVGKEKDVRNIAAAALKRFDRFDTWINNAGVSIYGRIEQIPVEDQRKLFETNFWGVVYGSIVAVEHLKQHGGALINLGSEVSDVAIPLQGIYSASKHAVKGFTDSLRLELEQEKAPVSVTLIKPAAIDTMYVAHAKNYMDVEPKLPGPIYAPELVADAILIASQYPKRDIFVGGAAKFFSSAAHYAPRMLDKFMQSFMFKRQLTGRPARPPEESGLHEPGTALQERQGQDSHVFTSSVYTQAVTHPKSTAAVLLSAGLIAALVWQLLRTPARRALPRPR